jgi:photosynthetic reaction center cytochrome c subunit
MNSTRLNSTRLKWILGVLGAALLLTGCERPPMTSVQRGYRGDGQVQIINPRMYQAKFETLAIPEAPPPADAAGPKASAAFKNVQVLGDLSVGQFTRLMVSMATWIAPDQSCTYCHQTGEDFSADTLYTKVVARRMLQMTRRINSQWKTHVGSTGVTCYTCHRGHAVPANIWFADKASLENTTMAGWRNQQNAPAPTVGLAALPLDPFTPYLKESGQVRVEASEALPTGKGASIQHTEWTYALMMHISKALGVNCTYCHNSRQFASWEQSSPPRVTAWYGIRMVRELNNEYLASVAGAFPPQRLGPLGDGPKVNCATCHDGVFKPMYGKSMLKDFPELAGSPAP